MAVLERACEQEDYKRVRESIERALDMAAAGEPWAIEFIASRFDGKPAQSIVGPTDDSPVIVEIIRVAANPDSV